MAEEIYTSRLSKLLITCMSRKYILKLRAIHFSNIENPELWKESERTSHNQDDKHQFSFDFVDLIRNLRMIISQLDII